MTRWRAWLLFGLGALLGLVAMGWVSRAALRAERTEQQMQRRAALEERVRLALWRMDSALAPLVARENARPYFHFQSHYPAERAYTRMFARLRPGEPRVASPLLGAELPMIRLHFQVAPGDRFSSPQVAEGREPPGGEEAVRRLAELTSWLQPAVLRASIAPEVEGRRRAPAPPEPPALAQVRPPAPSPASGPTAEASPEASKPKDAGSPGPRGEGVSEGKLEKQAAMNASEFEARRSQQALVNVLAQSESAPLPKKVAKEAAPDGAAPGTLSDAAADRFSSKGRAAAAPVASGAPRSVETLEEGRAGGAALPQPPPPAVLPSRGLAPPVGEGALQPLWLQGQLILLRQVEVEGRSYLQGCWLDWPALRTWLLGSVKDLLPRADLGPAAPGPGEEGRRLAALPLHLLPGPPPEEGVPPSTVRVALLFGWACALLAGLAGALVLHQALALGERRGAFVSAVTHELRTPLTTFRMYAELLWKDMVPDAAERRILLGTLVSESDRLDHLVKNVLSYARLEAGRARADLEVMGAKELLERCMERLSQRADQAGLALVLEAAEGMEGARLRTDASVVEQILFNLVDNACKYAAAGPLRILRLQAGLAGERLELALRDHGPGIPPGERRSLFKPFRKSSSQAARSAPGVGLGLALCRRLARSLGGDLRLDPVASDGARFVLSLPLGGG
ncbi:MAG: HAMP domain-containing histidine kinase [Acidobacteria bacterium]|nr:HAMP domain-containing histidine kinase [Acidobacteriota bacterium]